MTTFLLAVIAIAEVVRLVLTHKKQTKKRHFKQKLDGVLKMIWDLEFKRFKTKEIREDIRKEYDTARATIETLSQQIAAWPSDGNIDEKKRQEDKKVLRERDATRYEAQMKALDEEVSGARPSAENPEGTRGIEDEIDSLRELCEMLRDHIRSL